MSKKSGSYYTPENLASFIVRYVQENNSFPNKPIRILEPSCGDGAFLKAISQHLSKRDIYVDAIDFDASAIRKTRKAVSSLHGQYTITKADYLNWSANNDERYDLVIGNPPYISKKLLTVDQKKRCKSIHSKSGEFGTEFHNIWTSFLCDGVERLTSSGILAFVLPAEILKVKFAEKIQRALLKSFQRIEVFTFSKNVFPNIEQDTVILFLYKLSNMEGLYFTTIHDSSCLINNKFKLKRKRSLEAMKLKWSAYPLMEKQIKNVVSLKKRLPPIISYCETTPGIVTAANDYFIVNKSVVDKFELEALSKPIIQKGIFVNGCVNLSKDKLKNLTDKDKPTYFLDLSQVDLTNQKHNNYISIGKERKIDKRYKCSLRNKWYEVPGAWVSEGFFFKRCHDYPKFIYNDADALVTDSSYRIKMKDGYDIRSLIFSFYNSLTLAFSEVQGRYYGGGVLELTPSEFKSLPIPYMKITTEKFNEFANDFNNKKNINEIIERNDAILLSSLLGMTDDEIESLRAVRKTLMDRRQNISKSQFN